MSRRHLIWLALLTVAVLLSAVAVVHSKYRTRALVETLSALEEEADRLDLEWSALLIEQGTWGAPQRIEAEARRKLKMRPPRADEIIVVEQ